MRMICGEIPCEVFIGRSPNERRLGEGFDRRFVLRWPSFSLNVGGWHTLFVLILEEPLFSFLTSKELLPVPWCDALAVDVDAGFWRSELSFSSKIAIVCRLFQDVIDDILCFLGFDFVWGSAPLYFLFGVLFPADRRNGTPFDLYSDSVTVLTFSLECSSRGGYIRNVVDYAFLIATVTFPRPWHVSHASRPSRYLYRLLLTLLAWRW